MTRLFNLLALLGALILSSCQSGAGPAPLEGATMGGPFTLTAQDGRRVSDRDFAGKYRIIYFGYSFCPDVCPTDLATIGAGLRQFETDDAARAARIQPIFITVDPRRDTPPEIARYVSAFHPRLVGLTGTEAEIAQVARAYGVYYTHEAPARPGGDYLVNHSRMAVLYGPQGEPIAIVPHDQGPGGVAGVLDQWVR